MKIEQLEAVLEMAVRLAQSKVIAARSQIAIRCFVATSISLATLMTTTPSSGISIS